MGFQNVISKYTEREGGEGQGAPGSAQEQRCVAVAFPRWGPALQPVPSPRGVLSPVGKCASEMSPLLQVIPPYLFSLADSWFCLSP